MKKVLILWVSLLCASVLIPEIASKRGDESKYTAAESRALVQLRKAVAKDLYEDYMSRDEYLITWLRARKLDVRKAAEMLHTNLKWRKDEKIDDLPKEKFPQFTGFIADLEARDREGRPVLLFPYSTWDTRKAALSGQMKLLVRYLVARFFEGPQAIARHDGQADGTNATQIVHLIDLGGYNLRQHACILCFELYTGYILNYERYYPHLIAHNFAFNTPKIFDPVLAIVRPIFSEQFTRALQLLGPDRDEWKPKVLKYIAPNQIPSRFGGTSTRKLQSG